MADTKRTDRPPVAEEYSPEAHEPAGYRLSDADIKEQVCRRLAEDAELDASGITVDVQGGEVTLSGSVRRSADMQKAENDACLAEGVKLVRNRLIAEEPRSDAREQRQPTGAAPKMGKPSYEL
jgi:osmotically-inducible protein OsmY